MRFLLGFFLVLPVCADSMYSLIPVDGTVTGINNSGQVVGLNAAGAVFVRNADGTVQTFNIPGGAVLRPFGPAGYVSWPEVGLGINDLGQIAGNGAGGVWVRNADGTIVNVPFPGFATGINNSGQLTGFSSSPGTCGALAGICGVVYDMNGGSTTAFKAYFETWALGINDLGEVVGQTQNVEKGFLRGTGGTSAEFGDGFPNMGAAFDINDLGQIAGAMSTDPAGIYNYDHSLYDFYAHGLIYDTQPTVTVAAQVDYPGADYTFLTGINDQGEAIGRYIAPDGTGSFIADPVPEPGSFALLLTVLALAGLGARRRAS